MAIIAMRMTLQRIGSLTSHQYVIKVIYSGGKLLWWEPGEDTHAPSDHLINFEDIDRLELH